jgi:hypothetical protein
MEKENAMGAQYIYINTLQISFIIFTLMKSILPPHKHMYY